MLDPKTGELIQEAFTRVVKKEVKRISFENERVIVSAYWSLSHLPSVMIEVRAVASSTQ